MASILTADDLVNIKHTVLTLERQEIARNVDPNRFFGHLRAKYVFDERDCDEIRAQPSRVGSAEVFVDTLKRKGGRGYDEFCNALMNDKTQLFLLQRLTQTLELLRARVIERKTEKGLKTEQQQIQVPLQQQFSQNQTTSHPFQYHNQHKPSHLSPANGNPSNLSSNLSSTLPSNFSSTHSSNLPSTLPSNFSSTHSSNLPSTLPSNFSSTHSSNLPSTLPSNFSSTHSSNLPSTLPSNFSSTLPSNFYVGNMQQQQLLHNVPQFTSNTPTYLTQHSYPNALPTGRQQHPQQHPQQFDTHYQQQSPIFNKPLRKVQSRQTEKEYNQQSGNFTSNLPNPNPVVTNTAPVLNRPQDTFAPITQQNPQYCMLQPQQPFPPSTVAKPYRGSNDYPQDYFWKHGPANAMMFPRGMTNHGSQTGGYGLVEESDQPCGQVILARGST